MGRKDDTPLTLNKKEEDKPYSRGVAYGLYDQNNSSSKPYTKGVAYSLFDKSVLDNTKPPVKKGTYGAYDKSSEYIALHLDEVAPRNSISDKGTYFTFGRMKEHLFFRVEKPNRNRNNNSDTDQSEDEANRKIEAMLTDSV